LSAAALERLVDSLVEANPMLGHRGCRLGITYPEITEMQARAIFEAACRVVARGKKVVVEVMIPLVAHVEELKRQAEIVRRVAQEGVGKLIEIAVRLGRGTRSDLKIGICGEHGGEPRSVKFCHHAGMNYVSCSPFRLPIARLAAAQAALEEQGVINRTKATV